MTPPWRSRHPVATAVGFGLAGGIVLAALLSWLNRPLANLPGDW